MSEGFEGCKAVVAGGSSGIRLAAVHQVVAADALVPKLSAATTKPCLAVDFVVVPGRTQLGEIVR
ncbi:hypothetical protein [Micromonospora sp. NPDC003776]